MRPSDAAPNLWVGSDVQLGGGAMIGANVVRRYFSVGELSPAAALINNPSLDFRSPRGRSAIEATSRRLQAIDDVAEVRSLTQPVGRPLCHGRS